MTTVVSKFDGRMKLIEENQNKIANSLSRFLDKMNSLLFKGNYFVSFSFKIQRTRQGRKQIQNLTKSLWLKGCSLTSQMNSSFRYSKLSTCQSKLTNSSLNSK